MGQTPLEFLSDDIINNSADDIINYISALIVAGSIERGTGRASAGKRIDFIASGCGRCA